MKITRVDIRTEHIKLTRPYSIAFKTFDSVDNIFVRIETKTGMWGIGAACPLEEVTGESFKDCSKALEENLEGILTGRDIRHMRALCREIFVAMPDTPGACAAADIALHDLYAKYLKIPLVDVYGRIHKSFPTSITIGIKSVKESVEEAREYINRGFSILKVKIGKSPEEDVERLVKIREKVGKNILIRVDANQGYNAYTFKEFVNKTRPVNIEFTEQPLRHDDASGMRSLPEKVRKMAAADESLKSRKHALLYSVDPQPFGIYNIKLMKCGGILPGIEIATIAHIAGIDVMWGCNDESVVSISAALHAAMASPATKYIDLDGSFDLARDPYKGGFILKDGCMSITGKPGLGVIEST